MQTIKFWHYGMQYLLPQCLSDITCSREIGTDIISEKDLLTTIFKVSGNPVTLLHRQGYIHLTVRNECIRTLIIHLTSKRQLIFRQLTSGKTFHNSSFVIAHNNLWTDTNIQDFSEPYKHSRKYHRYNAPISGGTTSTHLHK